MVELEAQSEGVFILLGQAEHYPGEWASLKSPGRAGAAGMGVGCELPQESFWQVASQTTPTKIPAREEKVASLVYSLWSLCS